MSILVFLCLSVLDLGLMYATDRQTDVRETDAHHRLMSPPYGGGGGGIKNHIRQIELNILIELVIDRDCGIKN